MISRSTNYKLTNLKGVVIAEGPLATMHAMRKQRGPGHRVWNSFTAKIGDTLPRKSA